MASPSNFPDALPDRLRERVRLARQWGAIYKAAPVVLRGNTLALITRQDFEVAAHTGLYSVINYGHFIAKHASGGVPFRVPTREYVSVPKREITWIDEAAFDANTADLHTDLLGLCKSVICTSTGDFLLISKAGRKKLLWGKLLARTNPVAHSALKAAAV